MGSFTNWLRSTEAELDVLRDIENKIQAEEHVEARSLLEKLDLTTLIKYTELSQTIQNFCSNLSQSSIWISRMDEFKKGDFSLQLYQPITPCQLIKGIYFFWQAMECRAAANARFQDDELEFLKKSAEFHCFYAYNSLSTWAFEQYKTHPEVSALVALSYAKEASQYHWTPGYLLLYKTYYNLAASNENCSYLYNPALEALLIAKKLSDHSNSISAINNAYFGKGIVEGNKSQFTSWDRAVEKVLSNSKINVFIINTIHHSAMDKAKEILVQEEQIISDVIDTSRTPMLDIRAF
ncbi:DUF5630 domain-containing protein [Legionella bononiensis]|uniref:DUF5630 domain-containing protein n=1 Tax=Legionella bononiensis TaxID=2793102 RepID=A0ABS1W8X4_9GAMM|nr:DUF5630 domain-containing protein [Legionella bononiensis]MBL7479681.1 DUF5630 domain-containing protein [Legionella bononiensis]MBL7525807.1 DUF5630 domain-containing protein [Legionella bononiensis]MBL7561989.1 DUF5630 domain-containing protein [Legionella bononiensis]